MATPAENLLLSSSSSSSSSSAAWASKSATQKSEISIGLSLLARNLPLPPDLLRAVSQMCHAQTGDEMDVNVLNCGKLLQEFDVTMLMQQIKNLSCSDLKFLNNNQLDTAVQQQIIQREGLQASAGEEMQLTWLSELHKLWHSKAKSSMCQLDKKQLAALHRADQEAYIHRGESSKNERLEMLPDKTSYLQHQKDSGQVSMDPAVVSSVSMSKKYKRDDGRINQNFIKVTKQPSIRQEEKLRSYQLEGLQWMVPSTERKGLRGTHLIIAPECFLREWQHDFETLLPSITTVLYIGKTEEREKLRKQYFGGRKFNVLLTHFNLVIMDEKYLRRIFW